MIDRTLLQEMFDNMRGKAKWNIDGKCLWGYFFTDTDRTKLAAAAEALDAMGYRPVGLLEPSPDDEDQETIFLHVEREEKHTVDSLDARNKELEEFAQTFGLATYDGMDVGPI